LDVLQVKAQIVSKIAHAFVLKDIINIYISEQDDLAQVKGMDSSLLYTSYEEADIAFIDKKRSSTESKNERYIFSTSYYLYQNDPHVIGTFFWQKGRPTILIKSSILKEKGIVLPDEFTKYEE
jgi:hypothetical protein